MSRFDKIACSLAMRYNGQVITKEDVMRELRAMHIPMSEWYGDEA